jgi:predicted lysophospholipase L1 biosynthesis ABC-type transport system permease subunit
VLLLAFPASAGDNAAGYIWKIAAHLPAVDGSSLLFWLLVPLAGAVLCVRLRIAPRPWLVAVFAALFLISAVAIRYPWQKYVDPFALLVLLLTVRRDELSSPWRLAGAVVLAIAFLGYALDLSSHQSVPKSAHSAPRTAVAMTVTTSTSQHYPRLRAPSLATGDQQPWRNVR